MFRMLIINMLLLGAVLGSTSIGGFDPIQSTEVTVLIDGPPSAESIGHFIEDKFIITILEKQVIPKLDVHNTHVFHDRSPIDLLNIIKNTDYPVVLIQIKKNTTIIYPSYRLPLFWPKNVPVIQLFAKGGQLVESSIPISHTDRNELVATVSVNFPADLHRQPILGTPIYAENNGKLFLVALFLEFDNKDPSKIKVMNLLSEQFLRNSTPQIKPWVKDVPRFQKWAQNNLVFVEVQKSSSEIETYLGTLFKRVVLAPIDARQWVKDEQIMYIRASDGMRFPVNSYWNGAQENKIAAVACLVNAALSNEQNENNTMYPSTEGRTIIVQLTDEGITKTDIKLKDIDEHFKTNPFALIVTEYENGVFELIPNVQKSDNNRVTWQWDMLGKCKEYLIQDVYNTAKSNISKPNIGQFVEQYTVKIIYSKTPPARGIIFSKNVVLTAIQLVENLPNEASIDNMKSSLQIWYCSCQKTIRDIAVIKSSTSYMHDGLVVIITHQEFIWEQYISAPSNFWTYTGVILLTEQNCNGYQDKEVVVIEPMYWLSNSSAIVASSYKNIKIMDLGSPIISIKDGKVILLGFVTSHTTQLFVINLTDTEMKKTIESKISMMDNAIEG